MAEPTNPIYSSINPNVAIGPRSHAIPTYSGDKNQEDPSQQIPGMPPNYGQTALPHVITFQGIVSSVARVYRPSDEAMKDSFANARYMRNDPNIMECLEMRRRSTALLGWHIEPDDEKDPAQKWLCEEITDILRAIPRFTQLRECLMDALWYGKYAVQFRYRWKPMRGGRRVVIDRWLPVNGDKLVFRYDDGTGDFHEDQLGIRVGAGFTTGDNVAKRWQVERLNKVEPTDYGLAYFLEPWERKLLAVHKHMIEDGEYEEPRNAGRIHGVGIRSRIYWLWYQRQECLAWLMEFLERSAFGIEIWYYPWGSAKAREETRVAAEERIGQGRNIILVPKPMGEEGMSYGVERIEPGMQGAEILKDILQDYFGHAVKRYILGQTLTTEADSTGLGSNLATIHLDTYLQIVKYDATNLEETLTEELVKPLIEFNFPKFANVPIRFAIETESPDVQGKLEAWRQAYEMGCRLRESDVMDLIGAMMPEADENALENPQHTQAKQQAAMGAMGMGGQPGMGGEPGMDGPGGGDPGGADPGPFDDGGGGGSGSGPQPPEPPGPEDYDADGEAIHSRAERKKLLDPEKSAEVAEQYARAVAFAKSIIEPKGTEADKEPVDADTLFDADTPPPSDLFDKTDAPSAEFGTLARDPGKAPPPPRRGRKPMPGQQGLWDDFDEPEKPKRQEQPLLFASETARLRYHLDREFCQRGLGSPFAPADDARLVRWLSSGIGTEIEVPDRFGQVYRYSRSHGNLSVERFARKPGKGQAAFWDEDDHPRNEAGEFAEKDTKDSPESGGKAEEKERELAPEKSANSAIDSSGDTAKIQVEGGRPPETKGTKEKGRGEKMEGVQKVGWKVEEREGVLFVTGTRYGDPNVAKLKRIGAKWDPTERAWWIPVLKRDKLEKLLGKVNEAKQEFADEAGRRKSAGLGLHIPYEASSIREYAKEFKAIWDKSDKQWLFPDEDAKSKVAARIAAWKSRQSSPSSKPKAAPAKAKTEPAPGERTLRGASGYGHRGWSEGQVVRTKDGEYLKILKASSRYVREDGLSFGVGDDSGYIYTAIARPATDEEAAPLKEKIAAEATRKAAAEQLTALREQVRANGEKPSGMHEPEGERFDDTQTLYGGGDWFVIGSEWIWHVQNNGADGDDWSRNNVRTGGAGGIGWRVPFDADLAQKIKDAAQKSRRD